MPVVNCASAVSGPSSAGGADLHRVELGELAFDGRAHVHTQLLIVDVAVNVRVGLKFDEVRDICTSPTTRPLMMTSCALTLP